ncbi:hypothetical protein XU18_1659 [Perkinsela sp. CCAP 1560/4]|nr:hypothetical protein XU18_1659 [Perkinsela sp. CCAP 1560/4]|eukprot:KNH07692.1 hypothetical protein XU18_1659 [Perkinsela sp. CCAP 1560/4]
MTTFIRAFIHLAYTASLLAVLLLVVFNISLPVCLQWPAYFGQSCLFTSPMYDQCVHFRQFHNCAYNRLSVAAGVTVEHIQRFFAKENEFFEKLLIERPSWFIISSVLFNVSAFISVLFWISTLLSDACARRLRTSTQAASMVIFCTIMAHAYFIFVDTAFDLDDVLDTINVYTPREHGMLALLYAFPLLQMLVLWSIPAFPEWMCNWRD